MGEFAVGQPVPRFEDPRLLRGGGRYVDDMVLPRMAFGHVLRSPHAHARIRRSTPAAAKAAPGVLAVLTGADWAGGGLGRSAGAGRHEAARRPADVSAALSGADPATGCAGSATTSPLSSPRRWHQAADAAELIEVDYEPLPAIVSTDGALGARRAAGLGRLPRQHLLRPPEVGNKRGGRGRARRAPTTSSSAASSSTGSPRRRWSRAAPSPTTTRAEAATRSTRRCSAPTPTAPSWRRSSSVPESQIRVVAGDIGGSFGMKSAIYNEVALVLLAVEAARPPGQMDQHALGGVPVRRAGARPRHRSRAGARQGRAFPRLPGQDRPPRSAPTRRPTRTRS